MYTSMSEAADEQRQAAIENGPNLDVIQDLRDVADWLEQHPELPKVFWAVIRLRSPHSAGPAREVMTTIAEALGDRAKEALSFGDVKVGGYFGEIEVTAIATPKELGGTQAVVEYDPILAPAPEVELPISTDELIAEAER